MENECVKMVCSTSDMNECESGWLVGGIRKLNSNNNMYNTHPTNFGYQISTLQPQRPLSSSSDRELLMMMMDCFGLPNNFETFLETLDAPERDAYITSFIRPSDEIYRLKKEHSEFYETTRAKEVKQMERNLKHSISQAYSTMYDKSRSRVIYFIWYASNPLDLYRTTLETSVYIYDTFLARKELPRDKLQLAAITAIYLAIKSEETFINTTIQSLCDYAGNAYTCQNVLEMQQDILVTIEWNILPITCSHFLDYLMLGAMEASDFLINAHMGPNLTLWMSKFEKTIGQISDVVLFCPQNYKTIKPSILASASIAATRRILNIFPVWKPGLAWLSGYEMTDLKSVYENIIIDYHKKVYDIDLDVESYFNNDPYPAIFLKQILKQMVPPSIHHHQQSILDR
ncbi:hypothetical protein DFA_03325 [Cavenderia fasciculata]|uniref:Cyclin-like domain-containing protein n=1 Tax=Cavenderia fasciculata TaxID=261658 RepID=F4PH95_CACFS|nr:uncharacterized protein DFA_03325 [Cavenderia fasciculata]EGG25079.1 hypothetical protein DFA_03325 [Cavenderia fasciculata]|eukprot:XP_004362930.1 hypothetical protein DFA_03325 [Cavenderia fasciculata]